jgi:hypothetical protein
MYHLGGVGGGGLPEVEPVAVRVVEVVVSLEPKSGSSGHVWMHFGR